MFLIRGTGLSKKSVISFEFVFLTLFEISKSTIGSQTNFFPFLKEEKKSWFFPQCKCKSDFHSLGADSVIELWCPCVCVCLSVPSQNNHFPRSRRSLFKERIPNIGLRWQNFKKSNYFLPFQKLLKRKEPPRKHPLMGVLETFGQRTFS